MRLVKQRWRKWRILIGSDNEFCLQCSDPNPLAAIANHIYLLGRVVHHTPNFGQEKPIDICDEDAFEPHRIFFMGISNRQSSLKDGAVAKLALSVTEVHGTEGLNNNSFRVSLASLLSIV